MVGTPILPGGEKEGLGGAITVASLLIFYLIFVFLLRDNLARGGWFLVFALPGFLFLDSYAIFTRASIARGAFVTDSTSIIRSNQRL